MEDNLPTGTPEEENQPDLTQLLTSLGEQVSTIGSRLDDFDTRFEGFMKPVEPEKPQEGWQPKSWDDIPRLVEEKGSEVAKRILDERDAMVQKTADEEKQQREAIDKQIDEQAAKLEKEGIIPPIQDEADDNDAGKNFRKELFGYMAFAETLNMPMAAQTLKIMHDKGSHFDWRAGKFIQEAPPAPGASAPVVSSGRRSGGSPTISYKDLHGLTYEQLAQRGMNGK